MNLPLSEEFLSIVLDEKPLLDVRAPIEFEKGSFPNAKNIAILDDEQRRLVGIRYKEKGNTSAVELGRELVNKEVQALRIKEWKAYLDKNPDALIYCFRGGQRSRIVQTWLAEVGITRPRLKGGYKAFRNFLLQRSEELSAEFKTIIIGGRTGSGKTRLLQELNNMIDLEGLARHRGSSFGKLANTQPSQIDFEDALYYKLIQHYHKGHKHLVIEHESHRIGDVYIPKPIFDNFTKGGLIILETPLAERVEITYDEYVVQALKAYEKKYAHKGSQRWFEDVNAGLDRIKKRLGSQEYLEIKAQFKKIYEADNSLGHKVWIERLLTQYYDPMYDYQLQKSPLKILFRGKVQEVLAFLKSKED